MCAPQPLPASRPVTEVRSFDAVLPRPKCEPYYDITVGGSDDEGPTGDLAGGDNGAWGGSSGGDVNPDRSADAPTTRASSRVSNK